MDGGRRFPGPPVDSSTHAMLRPTQPNLLCLPFLLLVSPPCSVTEFQRGRRRILPALRRPRAQPNRAPRLQVQSLVRRHFAKSSDSVKLTIQVRRTVTSSEPPSVAPDPVTARPVRVEIGAGLLARTWRSAVREFALIVAGVLTALAAQAWWETRQERAREEAYLLQLVADARETERRLGVALAEEELAEISTRSIAEAVRSGGPLLEDSIRAWLTPPRWIFWYSDPRPVLGTVASLLETGDLRVMRADKVR